MAVRVTSLQLQVLQKNQNSPSVGVIDACTTNLTTLWKITAADGTVRAVTSNTRPITYDGTTYYCVPVTPARYSRLGDNQPSNMEIIVPLESVEMTEAELRAGFWNRARVEVRIVDYETLEMVRLWVGFLSEATEDNGRWQTEVLDLAVLMQAPVGRTYGEQCDVKEVGDARCQLDMTSLTYAVEIIEVLDNQTFKIDVSKAENAFQYGQAIFTAGANDGFKKEIKTNPAGDGSYTWITLVEPMPLEVEVGDELTVKEGCQRTPEDCISKGNMINFRAFPRIPGIYKIQRFPE